MVPYNRPYPQMIIQDPDLLMSIANFDYDLFNDDFVRYFEDRTGVKIKTFPDGSINRECWENTAKVFGDVMAYPIDRFQKIIKGKLQDCWEIWKTI